MRHPVPQGGHADGHLRSQQVLAHEKSPITLICHSYLDLELIESNPIRPFADRKYIFVIKLHYPPLWPMEQLKGTIVHKFDKRTAAESSKAKIASFPSYSSLTYSRSTCTVF